jgi:DNA repair protein RadA/Sms
MNKKFKTAFVCTRCGAIHPRWQGQCRECGEWNCLAEEQIIGPSGKKSKAFLPEAIPLKDISDDHISGYSSGVAEFDRVLGGVLLPGSTVLIAGEPGIGKSTLILQAAASYSETGLKILYVTGEESLPQLKKRSRRLSVAGDNISVTNLTDVDQIVAAMETGHYHVAVVDSIQTVSCPFFASPPGTIGQIRESAGRMIEFARKNSMALFLIGHVTKEGFVAGPKILEHMVDAVLYFEGDSRHLYRILRPIKNRYGSTCELGVFEMSAGGLQEVENPSSLFLSDYDGVSRSGTIVAASCEGNRSILVEIQALVSSASYGTPQRVAGGIDNKRLALLLAILEKRIGIPMGSNDVFVSVAGGLKLSEPAIDLAVLAVIVSSLRDVAVDKKSVVAGEVGLSGEVRPVAMAEQRIAEAAKLGFERIIVPQQNVGGASHGKIEVIGASTLERALEIIF